MATEPLVVTTGFGGGKQPFCVWRDVHEMEKVLEKVWFQVCQVTFP